MGSSMATSFFGVILTRASVVTPSRRDVEENLVLVDVDDGSSKIPQVAAELHEDILLVSRIIRRK